MMNYVDEEYLIYLTIKKFVEAGVQEDTAKKVAEVLVYADKTGVSSHGVLRVEHYCKRVKSGGMNPEAHFSCEVLSPSAAIFDADDGMGHAAMIEATDQAISMAKESGIASVLVKNTSHCGALSYYASRAADAGMCSIIMTQTDKCVAPFGGAKPFFGTNPLAFGFPVEGHESVIIDMATSEVALGKILHARETGKEIPSTWAVDENGAPTTDPNKATTLLPFAGPKGYSIALAIDALTGVLAGAAYGPHINGMYSDYEKMRKLGSSVLVIDPTFFGNNNFAQMMANMVNDIHEAPAAPGFNSVMYPGEPQHKFRQECEAKGKVPVAEEVYAFLTD
jgi:LDH2 family malate/lactate/ureidoglycolate dehydrogenase